MHKGVVSVSHKLSRRSVLRLAGVSVLAAAGAIRRSSPALASPINTIQVQVDDLGPGASAYSLMKGLLVGDTFLVGVAQPDADARSRVPRADSEGDMYEGVRPGLDRAGPCPTRRLGSVRRPRRCCGRGAEHLDVGPDDRSGDAARHDRQAVPPCARHRSGRHTLRRRQGGRPRHP